MPSVSPADGLSRAIQDGENGAVLTVHAQPRASHTAFVGVHGNAIKIRIAAPPVDGAANEELVRFLSSELRVPAAMLHVESGRNGRHKRVRLTGITAAEVMARLAQRGSVKQ